MTLSSTRPTPRTTFIVGFLVFACPSLISVGFLLAGGYSFGAEKGAPTLLLALALVLAYGPANIILVFVVGSLYYASQATWVVCTILGWITSGAVSGAGHMIFVRWLGPKRGYPVALIASSLVLLPIVLAYAALLSFGG